MIELNHFRPVPFYFLNTAAPEDYTTEAVNSAMNRMKALGYGGIVLFNKPPTGFDADGYLSETWFDLTGKFISAAKELDLQLWINDGFNYPPGDAAGRIAAVAPELKQLRLNPNREGKLDILETSWGFPAFEEPRSSELFIKFTYEEYYRRFAEYFGNGITGFFSDADNRRFNAGTKKLCPERYYPWSRNFPEIFFKRFNYRIEEHLKELFDLSDPQVMSDYWQLCGDLYRQWFANNYRWCQEHGVLYTFHTSDTGPLNYSRCRRSSAFTEGDTLALTACADFPGTDHELMVLDGGTHYDERFFTPKVSFAGKPDQIEHPALNDTSWDIRAKYVASAAFLNRKNRVMCEMFAATNWSADYNSLSRIAAWQIMQGVNFIVPHAVHHRFTGVTKFFAPPEFTNTTMQYGLRQFNDRLARWCQAAAAGEYLAEYAVIDPTPEVWKEKDSSAFFHLCDRLNRRAEGYVIVPPDYSGPIKNIIDPLKNIPDLPPPTITFTGGELAFMRRELDGTEYLLAANVWENRTLSGTLNFQNQNYDIELEPGEIAIIGGIFESYRKPEKFIVKHRFSGKFPVRFQDDNLIPFNSQLTVSASGNMAVKLLVPKNHTGTVSVDDTPVVSFRECDVFNDRYHICSLTLADGTHTVKLENPAEFHTPALLAGDFDVKVSTTGDYHNQVYRTYQLAIYEPAGKTVELSPRRRELDTSAGWEQQGQIFYSGMSELDLGKVNCQNGDMLALPEFTGTAELMINGKSAGIQSIRPCRFVLPQGENYLQLRLWNSMANRLERYAEVSGVTVPPEIIAPC